ncbi:MAG: tRNA (cytidine(34)-2'-O)-methyltransferase [Planctomycetota bacterium]|jgi:tRNA (cytidine/uridine-2'-O-)-methyltransferase
MPEPRFHIVLLNPQIPNNTGNIGRTAAAAGCRLHVVHPAGLDYWHLVDCREHASWEAFLADECPGRLWLFTTRSNRPHWAADLRAGDYLLFGTETGGVPAAVHEWVDETWGPDHRITLPMIPGARSLNLATVVCAAVYEGLRQVDLKAPLSGAG